MLEIVTIIIFVIIGVVGFVGIGLLFVIALGVLKAEKEKEMAIAASLLKIEKSNLKIKKEVGDR